MLEMDVPPIFDDEKAVIEIFPKRRGRPRKHHTADARRAAQAKAARLYRQRKKRSVHHKSDSQEWYTPSTLLDDVLSRLGMDAFDLDPCSPRHGGPVPANHHYTRADDGLAQPWYGTVFCNPPYGREIAAWADKATREAATGAQVIMLVPARTDTKWWHSLMAAGGVPEFLPGRIRFERDGQPADPAPFPSALIWIGDRPASKQECKSLILLP